MAELIDKGVALKLFDNCGLSMSRTFVKNRISNMPTTTEAEIRAKAIDEFVEKMKEELLLCKNIFSERRKLCESGSHMEGIYSSSIGTVNGVYSMVDEIAEQLKGEHGRKLNRCDTCTHYIADKVPPICYFCSKGIEDNYERKGE